MLVLAEFRRDDERDARRDGLSVLELLEGLDVLVVARDARGMSSSSLEDSEDIVEVVRNDCEQDARWVRFSYNFRSKITLEIAKVVYYEWR